MFLLDTIASLFLGLVGRQEASFAEIPAQSQPQFCQQKQQQPQSSPQQTLIDQPTTRKVTTSAEEPPGLEANDIGHRVHFSHDTSPASIDFSPFAENDMVRFLVIGKNGGKACYSWENGKIVKVRADGGFDIIYDRDSVRFKGVYRSNVKRIAQQHQAYQVSKPSIGIKAPPAPLTPLPSCINWYHWIQLIVVLSQIML
jgi:hypothetical protein